MPNEHNAWPAMIPATPRTAAGRALLEEVPIIVGGGPRFGDAMSQIVAAHILAIEAEAALPAEPAAAGLREAHNMLRRIVSAYRHPQKDDPDRLDDEITGAEAFVRRAALAATPVGEDVERLARALLKLEADGASNGNANDVWPSAAAIAAAYEEEQGE